MKIPSTPIQMLTLVMAMVLITGAMTGCSDDTSSPSQLAVTAGDDYSNLDFSQTNGGLTASDEDVAFGDKAFAEELYNEDLGDSDDPLLTDPEVMRLETMADDPADSNDLMRPRFTFARLEWGMVHGPDDSLNTREDCGVLDWSGHISVDRGLLVVRRIIRFEFPADHLVRPRPDRQAVGFVSHTGCHFDGLLVQIIERPEDLDPDLAANVLHINAGPFTGDFELNELVGMNDSFEVDELGNSLHLLGYSLRDVTTCPKGFLNGRWRLVPADTPNDTLPPIDPSLSEQMGTFGGPWLGLNGRIRGFMRCGYGLDANGNQVFAGKRIDRLGRFLAFVNGTWEAAADGVSLVSFTGDWTTADGMREGILGASAFPLPWGDFPGGFYEGRWSTICDLEAESQIP